MSLLKQTLIMAIIICISGCSSCNPESDNSSKNTKETTSKKTVTSRIVKVDEAEPYEDGDGVFVEYRTITDGDNSVIRVVRHSDKKKQPKLNYPPDAQPYLEIRNNSKILLFKFPEYKEKKKFSAHSYGIIDPETNEALVIDPGAGSVRMIQFWLDKFKAKLVAIAVTHGHLDHTGGVKLLKQQYPKSVFYAPADDAEWMQQISDVELFGNIAEIPPKADKILKDKDLLTVGRLSFQTIETPGHTKGSVCYYLPEEKLLFSGDTLFYKSVGATRFEHSLTMVDLIKSIKNKLKDVPDDVQVFPGHGKPTQMGFERKNNRYLQNQFE